MNKIPQNSTPDKNVEIVREKLLYRSQIGLYKYGITTERSDLSKEEWLVHLQEELLDAAVYVQVLISKEGRKEDG